MITPFRHRLVPASDPGAEPACRLTPQEGRRRQADTDWLWARLAEQRPVEGGNEFRFRGEREDLWQAVSTFVDEEAVCCPFFHFEQVEEPDGVTLRVRGEAMRHA